MLKLWLQSLYYFTIKIPVKDSTAFSFQDFQQPYAIKTESLLKQTLYTNNYYQLFIFSNTFQRKHTMLYRTLFHFYAITLNSN